jgi:potassium-transporting ATPase KdpC subunit
MKQAIGISLRLLLLLTILTGILYPVSMTGIATALFPTLAGGSLIKRGGQVIGSTLIAQPFHDNRYFWQRPSMTDDNPFPAVASNYGPTSKTLQKLVEQRRLAIAAENDLRLFRSIPSEMLYSSASGIDPHISPSAAHLQADRVSRARGLNAEARAKVLRLIDNHIEGRQFGILGEPRVNVLLLNIALDSLQY